MRGLRPAPTRRPLLGIAALCLALLGVPAIGFAGSTGFAASAPLGWETPHASTLDVAAAPQPTSEVSGRVPLRASAARAALHASPRPAPSAPLWIAERDADRHASPLLRWRLAHSTSSGVD